MLAESSSAEDAQKELESKLAEAAKGKEAVEKERDDVKGKLKELKKSGKAAKIKWKEEHQELRAAAQERAKARRKRREAGNEVAEGEYVLQIRQGLEGFDVEKYLEAWQRVVEDLDLDRLETMVNEISLADLPAAASAIMAGSVRGRTVVKIG